jgi:hypothetical protein
VLKDFAPNAAVNDITADNAPADSPWFNIHGQQVSKPSTPGLYINNGKKVIVK